MTETEKIQELFYNQIRKKTMQSVEQTFDYQFSDNWIKGR